MNSPHAPDRPLDILAKHPYECRIGEDLPTPHTPQSAHEALRTAVALHRAGELDRAIAAYEAAIALDPHRPEACNNLGVACREAGRMEQSIDAYRRAIELAPSHPQPWNNLGNVLRDCGQLDMAIHAYQNALDIHPRFAQALSNLGAALRESGQIHDALDCCRHAVALAPDSPQIHSNLLYAMHFDPASTPQSLLEAHQAFDARHAHSLAHSLPPAPQVSRGKLRIGYVSPDLAEHVVGRFLLPLLEHHNPERFEITCYSSARHPPNPITQRLQACAASWRDITRTGDDEAAQLIRADCIDILVDLSSHMAANRLMLFARRPAPIQVTFLAYCSTTGMQAMDYRLSDPDLDPPTATQHAYVERTVHLPRYWCYQPPSQAGNVMPRDLADSQITFGCLNSFAKASPPALDAWRKILQAVPASRLLLHAMQGDHRQRLQRYFEQGDVNPDRVHFAGFLPLADYFKLHEQIDIALDPFPYAGGTTTCDALWMGLPVVSLRGLTAVGRGGATILRAIGLEANLASSVDEYVQTATSLAANRQVLKALRTSLRTRMSQSALMNQDAYAQSVEAAFDSMRVDSLRQSV